MLPICQVIYYVFLKWFRYADIVKLDAGNWSTRIDGKIENRVSFLDVFFPTLFFHLLLVLSRMIVTKQAHSNEANSM